MIPRPLPRRGLTSLLLVFAAVFGVFPVLPVFPGAPAAHAQESDVGRRLDRLERDLNMLQRQVYGAGAAQAEGGRGGANLAVHTEIRLQQLESDMRRLTGRVEDVANAVKDLRRRVDTLANAVGERATAPASAGAAPAGAKRPENGPAAGELSLPPRRERSGSLYPPPSRETPAALTPPAPGGLYPPGGGRAGGGAGGALPEGSALSQYNRAFGLLKEADYEGAARAMKAFLRQHPNDPLAANAQYWLGETYYVRGRYQRAAAAFAAGYKNYPKGAKAPDDLLKLAMSLARGGQKGNACLAFTELHRVFPYPGSALAARAAAEEKRLGC